VSKAIGLILTITGLMLGWYFIQTTMQPGPAPLPSFVVAAIAVMMISVGIRYVIKSPAKKKNKTEEGSPQ
jgi:divalent metal cation (Fe/Co/Zn/Cd) transporter